MRHFYLFLLVLIFSPLFLTCQVHSDEEVDSLKNILKDVPKSKRIELLMEIASLYQKNDLNTALEFAQQAGEEAIYSNNSRFVANSFDLLGRIHRKLGNLILAKDYFNKGIEHANSLHDLKLTAKIKNNLAVALNLSGEYEEALTCLVEVINIYKDNNPKNVLLAELNKAVIFIMMGNHDTAIELLSECLIKADVLKLPETKSFILNNLGLNYFKLKKYDLALNYLEQSLFLKNSLHLSSSSFSTLKNIADVYVALHQYMEAHLIYQQLEDVAQKESSLDLLHDAYLGYGKISQAEKKYELAIEWYEKSLAIANKTENAENILTLNELMASLFAEIGKHEQAYIYRGKFIELKEKYFNEKTQRHVAELEMRHQIFRKNMEIEKAQEANALKRIQLIGLLIFSFLLILTCMLVFNRHQLKKHAESEISQKTKELTIQNNRIISQHREMEAQNKLLAQSNADLESFVHTINTDLKEPLNSIRTYMGLVEKQYEEKLDQQAKDFLSHATHGANRMESILKDLLLYTDLSSRLPKIQNIDLHVALNESIANLQDRIIQNEVILDIGTLPIVKGDYPEMVQVFQQLLDNSIKFRRLESPQIMIRSEEELKRHIVIITDNGIGIPRHAFTRIFQLFEHLYPDSEYIGNGVGLAIVKKVINRMGGDIWVDSEVGKGSSMYFSIPKLKDKN